LENSFEKTRKIDTFVSRENKIIHCITKFSMGEYYKPTKEEIIHHVIDGSPEIHIYKIKETSGKDATLFQGQLKNKLELKKIIEQLNINI
jgi:translation initiation factor 1 (eIF-1/SUI1)